MPRITFKHADPSRRTPAYLQDRTVENMVWQLKLLGLLFVWIGVRGAYDEYQWRKKVKKYKNPTVR